MSLPSFKTDTVVDDDDGELADLIHIRLHKNGKRTLTSISGIPEKYDIITIKKHLIKALSCNGSIQDSTAFGNVIQFQGDLRQDIKEFLLEEKICSAEDVRVHGY